MATYVEKWGPALAGAGHTQIPDGLLDGDITRALHLSTTEIKNLIGIIRAQGKFGYVESAKQLAYDSRVCYQTTRNNLKRLTAYKKDGGKALLIPVIMPSGRIRYNWMPLRKELEKLEKLKKASALEIVQPAPKVRPAPKPAPIVTIVPPDPDAWVQKEWGEIDEDAIADWEDIKLQLREEMSPDIYISFVAASRGDHWDDRTLWVRVPTTGHKQVLEGHLRAIERCSKRLFAYISIAFKVVLAATVGG